jgi:hypothetical protein
VGGSWADGKGVSESCSVYGDGRGASWAEVVVAEEAVEPNDAREGARCGTRGAGRAESPGVGARPAGSRTALWALQVRALGGRFIVL